MDKKFTKETLRRMGRTFLQAAISYIAINLAIVDFSESGEVLKSALIGLGVSALSAGIAAVMNLEEVKELTDTDEENVETVE